ncbi:MAG: hypothetical protein JWR09_3500 [Mucilaginibacter sp.]|nr:hypothetical protein [Mucilaginibacter sp.]
MMQGGFITENFLKKMSCSAFSKKLNMLKDLSISDKFPA